MCPPSSFRIFCPILLDIKADSDKSVVVLFTESFYYIEDSAGEDGYSQRGRQYAKSKDSEGEVSAKKACRTHNILTVQV